jgi:3-hydroxyanthranilate 3,4-dioxygenase
LYREEFGLEDIEKDMPGIFDNYYGNQEKRTCKKCNEVMEPPK